MTQFWSFLDNYFGWEAANKWAASAASAHHVKLQAVIKSAASADSLDLQGSQRTTARHADGEGQGHPCILVTGEAALAADLITGLIFKHLERNLAT